MSKLDQLEQQQFSIYPVIQLRQSVPTHSTEIDLLLSSAFLYFIMFQDLYHQSHLFQMLGALGPWLIQNSGDHSTTIFPSF